MKPLKHLLSLTVLLLVPLTVLATDFVAHGESRTNAIIHKAVVDTLCKEQPGLVIHVGNLWDG